MEHLQLVKLFRKKGMEKFKWILDDAAKTLDNVQQ